MDRGHLALLVIVPGASPLPARAAGLEVLPPRGAILIAQPMKIAGGSVGPLRAVAPVPKR